MKFSIEKNSLLKSVSQTQSVVEKLADAGHNVEVAFILFLVVSVLGTSKQQCNIFLVPNSAPKFKNGMQALMVNVP